MRHVCACERLSRRVSSKQCLALVRFAQFLNNNRTAHFFFKFFLLFSLFGERLARPRYPASDRGSRPRFSASKRSQKQQQQQNPGKWRSRSERGKEDFSPQGWGILSQNPLKDKNENIKEESLLPAFLVYPVFPKKAALLPLKKYYRKADKRHPHADMGAHKSRFFPHTIRARYRREKKKKHVSMGNCLRQEIESPAPIMVTR